VGLKVRAFDGHSDADGQAVGRNFDRSPPQTIHDAPITPTFEGEKPVVHTFGLDDCDADGSQDLVRDGCTISV
jgi:hypothetical protein